LGRSLIRWSWQALMARGCTELDPWVAGSNGAARSLCVSEGFVLEKSRESWALDL
jgi:hypothetical protein